MKKKYYDELKSIYEHLIVKKEGNIRLFALARELSMDEDSLANDLKYLTDEQYIEAKFLSGQKAGTVADAVILGVTAKGRDIVENKNR